MMRLMRCFNSRKCDRTKPHYRLMSHRSMSSQRTAASYIACRYVDTICSSARCKLQGVNDTMYSSESEWGLFSRLLGMVLLIDTSVMLHPRDSPWGHTRWESQSIPQLCSNVHAYVFLTCDGPSTWHVWWSVRCAPKYQQRLSRYRLQIYVGYIINMRRCQSTLLFPMCTALWAHTPIHMQAEQYRYTIVGLDFGSSCMFFYYFILFKTSIYMKL